MAEESVTIPASHLKVLTVGYILGHWCRSRGIIILVSILAVALVACGGALNGAGGARGDSGDMAADFAITMYTGASQVGGEEINFADLRGKPVVLNFWAGLCPPCRAEMPDLQEFHDESVDQVTLIGIDVGRFTGLGNQDDANDLLDSLSITYPTGYTGDASVMQDYAVLTMPTTVFIDSRGEIFRKWSGVLNQQTLDNVISEMLSQEPG